MEKEYVKGTVIANKFGVKLNTVYGWTKKGCPHKKVGTQRRYNIDDVGEWLDSLKTVHDEKFSDFTIKDMKQLIEHVLENGGTDDTQLDFHYHGNTLEVGRVFNNEDYITINLKKRCI